MELRYIESFGGIDADADDLWRDCFADHPAYLQALKHKRFLIVGRKGSGKTAIFKKLITERSPSHFSFGHTFNDYPWHYHDLQAQAGVPEELRYANSWKYLTLVSLAKILLNVDQSQPWSDESADSGEKLEDFIVDSYGSRDPDVTQLFSPNKEIKLKAVMKVPLLELTGERLKVKDLPIHIQEVNRQVAEHVFTCLNPENDYFVCFDQLDREYDPGDPKYSQRVVGLILAARDLSLLAKEYQKKLSVIVFLRDDIYDSIHFEDKNKITENYMATVRWEARGPGLTLKDLMEKRFAYVLGDKTSHKWSDLFDETKEMASRQTKYAHICDRTFLRPRDIIKFCNEVLAVFRLSPESEMPGMKFTNPAVIAARPTYSEYLLRELDDEIAKRIPDYRDYLEVLRGIGSIQFSLKEFRERWAAHPDLSDGSPEDALRQLFEFSVIGYLKPGGGGGGSKYVWKYQDARARLRADAETFRVHAGFKEALDLVRGARSDQTSG
jgi:hypothetical protein